MLNYGNPWQERVAKYSVQGPQLMSEALLLTKSDQNPIKMLPHLSQDLLTNQELFLTQYGTLHTVTRVNPTYTFVKKKKFFVVVISHPSLQLCHRLELHSIPTYSTRIKCYKSDHQILIRFRYFDFGSVEKVQCNWKMGFAPKQVVRLEAPRPPNRWLANLQKEAY